MARVSRKEVEKELRRIAGILKPQKKGLSRRGLAREYSAKFGDQLTSRTLQRRLEQLVIREEAIVEGEGPSTVYKPKDVHEVTAKAEEGYVPLSAQGQRLRDLVRRPIGTRSPVGYDPEWLIAYKPGKTWYLPKAMRARLHEVGRTPDEGQPAGTFAREILGRLLIDLAWASSRLEGNTYTRLDTQNLLEFGQRAEGKDAQEAQMILNHKAAIELLVSDPTGVGFNRATILSLHAALSENLLGDPGDEGRLRERTVSITGTIYTPTAIPHLIRECFDRILDLATQIQDPFEASFFVMVHVPYLQPFADVNKRTSRLAANIPFVLGNLCPLSFVDVPDQAYVEGTLAVYEEQRVELLRDVYAHAYERSCAQYRVIRESIGQPDPVRLRYRTQLYVTVGEIVRSLEPPRIDIVRHRVAAQGVPHEDLEAVAEKALEQLINLNEGSAGRNQIRPSEFDAWRQKFKTG